MLLVVIAIPASMLLPALAKANKIYCVNNLKQIVTAGRSYASGKDDRMPWEILRRDCIRVRDANSTETFRRDLENANHAERIFAWLTFHTPSYDSGSPNISNSPSNRMKKNANDSDWISVSAGNFNTSIMAASGTPFFFAPPRSFPTITIF